MSEKKKRRRFTTEQKARILSEHLFDKTPISEVCEKYDLQPSVIYDWQNRAKTNLALALAGTTNGTSSRERELEAKLTKATVRLGKKNMVIAELSEEYVTLKKSLGDL